MTLVPSSIAEMYGGSVLGMMENVDGLLPRSTWKDPSAPPLLLESQRGVGCHRCSSLTTI